MVPSHYWQDLTTKEFEALDPERTVAVLPVGAIEQHGPHLPVSVDADINKGLIEATLERLDADLPVLVLPAMPVGKSNEHIDFPGTLTLSAETLARLWFEIGESVHRAGVRKLVFFNSHGGQPQVMEIVMRDLRVKHGLMCVGLSWPAMGIPALFDPAEDKYGIHGGTVETAMMLHLQPDLVQMDKAKDFKTVMEAIEGRYEKLTYLGGVKIAWQTQDLNAQGACGDASAATAEAGKAVVEHVADGFATLLREVSAYPLEAIRER